MKWKTLWLFLPLALLSACATVPVLPSRMVEPAESLSVDKGYIAGVFYFEKKGTLLNPYPLGPSSLSVPLKSETGIFEIGFSSKTSSDIVLVECEPGIYGMKPVRTFDASRYMAVMSPPSHLTSGIVVERGSVIYIGDFWLQRREVLNSVVYSTKYEYSLERCRYAVEERYSVPAELTFRDIPEIE
jgi:hypothetical protein